MVDPLKLIPGYMPVGAGGVRKFASTDYAENRDRRISGQNFKNIDLKAIQRALSGEEALDDPELDDDEPFVRPKGRYVSQGGRGGVGNEQPPPPPPPPLLPPLLPPILSFPTTASS